MNLSKCRHIVCSLSTGGLLAVGLFLLLRGTPQVAGAGPHTLFVSTAGMDSGGCTSSLSPCRTLQYAVDRAADGDEIRLAAGTYTDIHPRAGITQVVYISKTVTVRGGYTTTNWTVPNPSAGPTTLDAQRQGRVIYITGDISPTVEGLCITGGDAAGFGGGLSDTDAGGGVYVVTATATIRDNQVFSNVAEDGGGLYLSNSATTLSGNTVLSNNAAGSGGGLFLGHSPATLSGNTVSANTAKYGGGLYLSNSDATLSGNTVSANTAHTGGGGLWLGSSAATLGGNTVLSNNAAGSGGGLGLVDSDAALISGNIAISNTAMYQGGGLYLFNSDATLSRNAITSNTAVYGSGGGVYLFYSAATLSKNTITSNTAHGGGGVWVSGSAATLSGNTVAANTAEAGGGLYVGSDATLINNVVVDNWANGAGSGLYIFRSSPRLLHMTIARNTSGDGSGIYVTDYYGIYSTVALTNTILVSQTVGITVTAGNTAILNRVLWYGSTTANIGGPGTITVTGEYIGNPAFAADGYHLVSGSAAIDQGVDAGVTSDIDGQTRDAAPDLGADEFVITVGSGDAYEPDDTCAQASVLATGGTVQQHTLHQRDDEDWARITVVSGTTYVLQATSTSPGADLTLELYDACDGNLAGSDDNAFGADARLIFAAPSSSVYYVKTLNHDPAVYGPGVTYELSMRTQSPAPIVVIVAGRNKAGQLEHNITYMGDQAYRTFRRAGVPRENIRYLSVGMDRDTDQDGVLDVDGVPSRENVRYAVRDWPQERGLQPGKPFYLYLVDHGGTDYYCAAGCATEERVSAADLDGWLSGLEAATGVDEVNVIIEACYSGSFIDRTAYGPAEISSPSRVVIASTGSRVRAFPSGRGGYFSDAFFTALGDNADLWTAYVAGRTATQAAWSEQTPWLDDNGDAVADGRDGMVARGRGLVAFGGAVPVVDWLQVGEVSEGGAATVTAQVRDDLAVLTVTVEVYPPGFDVPDTQEGEMPVLEIDRVVLEDGNGDGVYEGTYADFTEEGIYRLVAYAWDNDGNLSLPRQTNVGEQKVYLPLVMRAH